MAANGPAQISIEDFIQFFELNSAVPDDLDKPFFLDYDTKEADMQPNLQGYDESEFQFMCLLTTKRLLGNCVGGAKVIHADTTYKLTWEDYPIHVFGITDFTKAFHLIGVSISTQENTSTFEFCFKAIKAGVLDIFGHDLKWEALMSDAAGAIKNGFAKVHPDALKLTCHFHVMKSVKQRTFKDPVNKALVLENLSKLQQSPDLESFEKGAQLLISKWNKKESEFVKYMKTYWLNPANKFFFGGALVRAPSTNNALEATNGRIKTDFNLRRKLKMNDFKNKIQQIVQTFSLEYKDEIKKVEWTVPITDKLWEISYKWAKSDKQIIAETDEETDPDLTHYYMLSGEDNKLDDFKEDFETYKDKSWTSFDDFYKNAFQFWHVQIRGDDLATARCSCPVFLKEYTCKHLIGIGIRKSLVFPPNRIKKLEKRSTPRGRPKKTGPALSKT